MFAVLTRLDDWAVRRLARPLLRRNTPAGAASLLVFLAAGLIYSEVQAGAFAVLAMGFFIWAAGLRTWYLLRPVCRVCGRERVSCLRTKVAMARWTHLLAGRPCAPVRGQGGRS